MKKVAKLIIQDTDGDYLLMWRNNHPRFGNDPDLPGGTLEEGESTLQTMLREVQEEIGVIVDENNVTELYSGTAYSKHGTHYSLFMIAIDKRLAIVMSWEHSSYEWLSKTEFLEKTERAKDTYMHMVYDIVKHL